jgi:integrase
VTVVTKKPPRKGPLRIVQSGSVTVKIYQGTNRKPDGREYSVFTIAYFEHAKRKRQFFSSLDEAKTEAEKVARRLNRGEHMALQLSSADASSYLQATEQLAALGIPLHTAVAEYVHAVKLLEGVPIAEAAKDYLQRTKRALVMRTVAEVVDELLSERADKSLRYRQTLRSHLTRFKESFVVRIDQVSTLQMEAWLSRLKLGARGRNNVRGSLITLFRFARKRRYLPRGIATEADEIERRDVASSEANVYSPEELRQLLETADPRVLPAIAIGAFTGLRSASISRLRWENVKWEQSVVEIPAAIAKNGKRYLVPLLPCLAAWLAPYRAHRGKVVQGVRLEENLRELFRSAGVERRHNGLRDSFISYRVAQTTNLPQVAFEAGNSVEMIRSKYLEARTRPEAEKWFSIMPAAPANVVELNSAA